MCLWNGKNKRVRFSNSEEVREGCMEEETLSQWKSTFKQGREWLGQRESRDEIIPSSKASSHNNMKV